MAFLPPMGVVPAMLNRTRGPADMTVGGGTLLSPCWWIKMQIVACLAAPFSVPAVAAILDRLDRIRSARS